MRSEVVRIEVMRLKVRGSTECLPKIHLAIVNYWIFHLEKYL